MQTSLPLPWRVPAPTCLPFYSQLGIPSIGARTARTSGRPGGVCVRVVCAVCERAGRARCVLARPTAAQTQTPIHTECVLITPCVCACLMPVCLCLLDVRARERQQGRTRDPAPGSVHTSCCVSTTGASVFCDCRFPNESRRIPGSTLQRSAVAFPSFMMRVVCNVHSTDFAWLQSW